MDCRGRVFRCLMDGESLPFADLLRTTCEATAVGALTDYLNGKTAPAAMYRPSSMASIGG
jgi:hypothetical protein